jgi:hypothetical protein
VDELLIVSGKTRSVIWLVLEEGRYEPTGQSRLLGPDSATLAERIEWPLTLRAFRIRPGFPGRLPPIRSGCLRSNRSDQIPPRICSDRFNSYGLHCPCRSKNMLAGPSQRTISSITTAAQRLRAVSDLLI